MLPIVVKREVFPALCFERIHKGADGSVTAARETQRFSLEFNLSINAHFTGLGEVFALNGY